MWRCIRRRRTGSLKASDWEFSYGKLNASLVNDKSRTYSAHYSIILSSKKLGTSPDPLLEKRPFSVSETAFLSLRNGVSLRVDGSCVRDM